MVFLGHLNGRVQSWKDMSIISLFLSLSHDQLPSGAEAANRLPYGSPSPMPQSHVWHHDGMLEGPAFWQTHFWDPSVEAGRFLWHGPDIVWWCQQLLVRVTTNPATFFNSLLKLLCKSDTHSNTYCNLCFECNASSSLIMTFHRCHFGPSLRHRICLV